MKHYPIIVCAIGIISIMYFVTQGYFSLKAQGQKARDMKNCVNGASYPLREAKVQGEWVYKQLQLIKAQCSDIYFPIE